MKIDDNWFINRFKRTEDFLETSYECACNNFIKTTKNTTILNNSKDYLEFISCYYLCFQNDEKMYTFFDPLSIPTLEEISASCDSRISEIINLLQQTYVIIWNILIHKLQM